MKTAVLFLALVSVAFAAPQKNIVTRYAPKQVHVVSGARIDVWITVYVAQQFMFWKGRWLAL